MKQYKFWYSYTFLLCVLPGLRIRRRCFSLVSIFALSEVYAAVFELFTSRNACITNLVHTVNFGAHHKLPRSFLGLFSAYYMRVVRTHLTELGRWCPSVRAHVSWCLRGPCGRVAVRAAGSRAIGCALGGKLPGEQSVRTRVQMSRRADPRTR